MAQRAIEVQGLRELRRALKAAEGRSPKELQQANKQAAEIVAAEARRRAPKGPHQGGGNVVPVYQAIKAQASSGRGIVAFGGQRAPHGVVVNFGGTIPRRGQDKSVVRGLQAKHRSFEKAGLAVTRVRRREHIYSSITATRSRVLDEYEQALDRIARTL